MSLHEWCRAITPYLYDVHRSWSIWSYGRFREVLAGQDYYDREILVLDSMALTKLTFCDKWIMMGNRELCLVNQMQ